MARDHSKIFWEIYEKLMSHADGIERYIIKIDSSLKERIENDSKDHKDSLDRMLTNLNKYSNPAFWRVNNTVRGGDHTGNVGRTSMGTTINKTSSTQGDRIYLLRYSDNVTGKIYVMLVGYQMSHERKTDWRKEVRDIIHRHGGVEFDEEKEFNPKDPIQHDDYLLDWAAIYNVLEPGKIELTSNNKELLLNEANITITMEQFRNIARTPPLLIDGHAGTGKSIIIALRIAFQYYAHHTESKDESNAPRLLVVAYNERVLNMIERYTTYWMQRLLEYPDQYYDFIEYTPTLRLYHSLVKDVDYKSIPDPMSLYSARKFVNFFKFQNEFFRDIDDDSISAEQAWHFIRGILKGQGYGWYGWEDNASIQIEDFGSVDIQGKIPRKLTHRMTRELIEKLLGVFEKYETWRMDNHYIDDIDLVRKAFTALKAKDPKDRPKNEHLVGAFDNVLIDEAQDLTSKEFELLTHLLNSTEPKIVVGGDPLQTINPTGFSWTSLESFLYGKMDEGQLRKAERMLVSHRLPKKLVDFSNVIIEARSRAKNEDIELMQSAQKIKDDGFVARVSFDEKEVSEVKIIEEIMMDALNSNVGILLWARDYSELESISETDVILAEHDLNPQASSTTPIVFDIHSIESVKGLEYESIILYRFGDLDENFNAMSEESLQEGNEDPDKKNTYPILYHLNRLFIAASRAKKNIYIIDSEDSLKKSWSDVLWKNNISVDLNVTDFKEHINTEPSLEKAENYFEKGKADRDLNLLRKALASTMKCEDSDQKRKLAIQIRIVLIELEIINAGDEEKDFVSSKRLELIVLYEQTENLLEATKMRALLEQWSEIRVTCKGKKALDLQVLWNLSCFDGINPKTLQHLKWVLDHKKSWQDLAAKVDSQLVKLLRKRIRYHAKELITSLESRYIVKLQEDFGFQDMDIIDLLSPTWDQSKSAKSIKFNIEMEKNFTSIVVSLYGKNLSKLPIKAQIKYDQIRLQNPNISTEAADRLIESLAEKGDSSGTVQHIRNLFEKKEVFDPLDSMWSKTLDILEKIDEENTSDKDILTRRLRDLKTVRDAVYDSEKSYLGNKWKPAIQSFIVLARNPSIELSPNASGMKIFTGRGEIWTKTQDIINVTRHLNTIAKKLILNLKASGRMRSLLSKPRTEYLDSIFSNFTHYCETEIIDLIEKMFDQWSNTSIYDSESMLQMINFVDTSRKSKIRKPKDFITKVETFLLVSESFPVFYQDKNIVHEWIYRGFQKNYRERAIFNIAFGRWESGKEMPEGFDIQTNYEIAKKYKDQHIIQSYANELELDEKEMTQMIVQNLNLELINKSDPSTIRDEVKSMDSSQIEEDFAWENARWFTAQSSALLDTETFNNYLQPFEEVSKKLVISAIYSNSFCQSFTSVYGLNFSPDGELPAWSLRLLNHGHSRFKQISEEQASKSEFWELVEARGSFIDLLKVQKRTNYANIHLGMLACLESIFVFKKLKVAERIRYLKFLGVEIATGTKKSDVTDILFKQPFMKLSFSEIEDTGFERYQELYNSARSLLNEK